MSAIDVLHLVTAVIAVVSGVIALYRLAIGPGLLDRTVATDVLTACGIGLIAVMVVWWQREDLGVLLVILALTAFMTAVVVTRFAVREDASARRILTPEEAERQDRQRAEAELAAEQAELAEAARLAGGGTDAGPGASGSGDSGPAAEGIVAAAESDPPTPPPAAAADAPQPAAGADAPQHTAGADAPQHTAGADAPTTPPPIRRSSSAGADTTTGEEHP
ncbi:MAG: monovalent cation/H+ antiporter complex subunit F [Propionibacterium sp.]|nr:monovalent cation/H+ antiporter complex subunit F [Propionibacterium sp.]